MPALGLQHWYEKAIRHLWYPNITVVTEIKYPTLPDDKQILVPNQFWRWAVWRKNVGSLLDRVRCVLQKKVDYAPDFVVYSFKKMVQTHHPDEFFK